MSDSEPMNVSQGVLDQINELKESLYNRKLEEKTLVSNFKESFLIPRSALRKEITSLQKQLITILKDNGFDDTVIHLGDGKFEIHGKDEEKFSIKVNDPVLEDIDKTRLFKRRRKYIWIDNGN